MKHKRVTTYNLWSRNERTIVICICRGKKNHTQQLELMLLWELQKVLVMKIRAMKPSQNRSQRLFPDKESKSLSAVAWFIYYNQSRTGVKAGGRSKMWKLQTKTYFTHISIRLAWIILERDVIWWNSASLMAACVYSGSSDPISASRCHSSLVPNVFMLPLSAGIGLQRSDWKWFHSIFKEKRIYPFDCYLLAK